MMEEAVPEIINLENLNFQTVKEIWNLYLLEDGTEFKIKTIVKYILKRKEEPNPKGYLISHSQVLAAYPSEELFNQMYGNEGQINTLDIINDMKFSSISEDWNEYLLEDNTKIFVKLVPIEISRTDKIDKIGLPVYNANSQIMIKTKAPSTEK